MQLTQTRRRQLLVFAVVVYGLTIYSVYDATVSSVSFLQTTIKLTEGFNFVILCMFMLLNSALLWRLSTVLLFGNLRLIEYEHILERLPFTMINTILMTSMFKEQEFFTVILFGFLLLYVKVFHWILRDRLDGLLQNMQENTKLYNLIFSRFTMNMVILFIVDTKMVSYCIKNSIGENSAPSTAIQFLMGMEFSMLLIDLLNIFLHTSLNFYEFYKSQGTDNIVNIETQDDDQEVADDDENQFTGLEGKFLFERIIDIFTRVLKTLLHCLMLVPLKMPVMLMKDIVWDCITLYQNITMVWKTWRNNKQLDDKLPTVTEEMMKTLDIDNICIVCMDELIPEEGSHRKASTKYNAKRLPCGHVLHLCCLKNWMERSQTCPICRLPVFDENGTILPSRVAASNPQTQSEPGNPTDAIMQEAPTRTIPVPNVIDRGEEVMGSSVRQRKVVDNSWYSFPIEGSGDDSISFVLHDSRTDKKVPIKLLVNKNMQGDLSGMEPNKENEKIQQVVIPDEFTHYNETIDSLKRRICELENQVQDLNKRVKKD